MPESVESGSVEPGSVRSDSAGSESEPESVAAPASPWDGLEPVDTAVLDALMLETGMGISEELVRGTATTMSDRSNTIRRIVVAFMLCTAEEKHRTLDRN